MDRDFPSLSEVIADLERIAAALQARGLPTEMLGKIIDRHSEGRGQVIPLIERKAA